jgi:hypothetical protein
MNSQFPQAIRPDREKARAQRRYGAEDRCGPLGGGVMPVFAVNINDVDVM